MNYDREIEIFGVKWQPVPGVNYLVDYQAIVDGIHSGKFKERDIYRQLCQDDLFFLLYFVKKFPRANCEFVVNACRDVQFGPQTNIVDIWGREHCKTTIITVANVIRKILNNQNERIGLFAWKKELALSFLRSIKNDLESNELLLHCFPDILYRTPERESPSWGEEKGLVVKRTGNPTTSTLEAHGLVEGMPTGKHFSGRVYDDVTTWELCRSPDQMAKTEEAFFMSENVGEDGGWKWVVGTFYHHQDLLTKLRELKHDDGQPAFHIRMKHTLEGGHTTGRPVFLSDERVRQLRLDKQSFNTQHLLDPTPIKDRKLDYEKILKVSKEEIPDDLYKFMLIDPASEAMTSKNQDRWGIWVVGVEPFTDDVGASEVYILDGMIQEFDLSEALNAIVQMYTRNGRILKVGVEKVGAMTFEIHVSAALRARGKNVSVEAGTLQILRPEGRNKEQRILDALSVPLNNSLIKISEQIPLAYRERLQQEMEQFPYGRYDDGIDGLSYAWDIVKRYRFGKRSNDSGKSPVWTPTDYEEKERSSGYDWLLA